MNNFELNCVIFLNLSTVIFSSSGPTVSKLKQSTSPVNSLIHGWLNPSLWIREYIVNYWKQWFTLLTEHILTNVTSKSKPLVLIKPIKMTTLVCVLFKLFINSSTFNFMNWTTDIGFGSACSDKIVFFKTEQWCYLQKIYIKLSIELKTVTLRV